LFAAEYRHCKVISYYALILQFESHIRVSYVSMSNTYLCRTLICVGHVSGLVTYMCRSHICVSHVFVSNTYMCQSRIHVEYLRILYQVVVLL